MNKNCGTDSDKLLSRDLNIENNSHIMNSGSKDQRFTLNIQGAQISVSTDYHQSEVGSSNNQELNRANSTITRFTDEQIGSICDHCEKACSSEQDFDDKDDWSVEHIYDTFVPALSVSPVKSNPHSSMHTTGGKKDQNDQKDQDDNGKYVMLGAGGLGLFIAGMIFCSKMGQNTAH